MAKVLISLLNADLCEKIQNIANDVYWDSQQRKIESEVKQCLVNARRGSILEVGNIARLFESLVQIDRQLSKPVQKEILDLVLILNSIREDANPLIIPYTNMLIERITVQSKALCVDFAPAATHT